MKTKTADKMIVVERYPTRETSEARVVMESTRRAADRAATALYLMRADNVQHRDQIEQAEVALRRAGRGKLVTNDEALVTGGGGNPIVHKAKPGQRDPYLAPWSDDELDQAAEAADRLAAEAKTAQTKWIKLAEAGQLRDVLTECRQEQSQYYWRVDRGEYLRGDPVNMTTVLSWPRFKLESLLNQNLIGQIPASLYMADSQKASKKAG